MTTLLRERIRYRLPLGADPADPNVGDDRRSVVPINLVLGANAALPELMKTDVGRPTERENRRPSPCAVKALQADSTMTRRSLPNVATMPLAEEISTTEKWFRTTEARA